jgi:hypothetical protein
MRNGWLRAIADFREIAQTDFSETIDPSDIKE